MRKRIPELDFIKGIAIILVIIGHVISQVWNSDPAVYENAFLFRLCYSFHMPLFVFVSGWICCVTMKTDIHWLIKRIRRIALPYIIMTVFVFFLLRRNSISQFIINTPYWYLIFIIIADSIFFVGEKLGCRTITFGITYCIILLMNWKVPLDISILRQLADFLPFYYLGTLIPSYRKKTEKYGIPILMLLGFVYIGIFPVYRHGISGQLEYFQNVFNTDKLSYAEAIFIIGMNKFIVPVCGIALVFLLTNTIYNMSITKKFREALEIAGNHTLAVYLLHDLFLIRITGNNLADSIISAFTAFFIPLALSALYNILKTKNNRDNLSK
ncbi:MAG: acyltransferase family protein [Ruminococcus sp.]|nr:acyltransferase family protein [Ruminococcus sp.]